MKKGTEHLHFFHRSDFLHYDSDKLSCLWKGNLERSGFVFELRESGCKTSKGEIIETRRWMLNRHRNFDRYRHNWKHGG